MNWCKMQEARCEYGLHPASRIPHPSTNKAFDKKLKLEKGFLV